MEAIKKQVVTHNATKVKALLFLEMRKRAGYESTRARDIATAINGNVRSLYVLLERWLRWDLVLRYDGTPFTYCIDTEGERYLSKINAWFFCGYYSRKRKRRVLGYRGNELKLRLELAAAANMIFATYDTKRGELFYFKAPYHKAADFVREPIIDGKRKKWGAGYLLMCARATLVELYKAMTEIFGEEWCKPAGQAMVDADLGLYWKSHE